MVLAREIVGGDKEAESAENVFTQALDAGELHVVEHCRPVEVEHGSPR